MTPAYAVSISQIQNYLLNRSLLNQKATNLEHYFDTFKCIQVDPINVVAPSHYLALYNRIKDFSAQHLEKQLYPQRKYFEYWLQLYSIIPIKYYPLLTARMHIQGGWHLQYSQTHAQELNRILSYIKNNGPTSSLDLSHIPKTSTLGSWGNTKTNSGHLKYLWDRGQIMVHHRKSGRKYYELTHKVLPPKIANSQPKITSSQSLNFLITSGFHYLGITRPIYSSRPGYTKFLPLKQTFTQLINQQQIIPLSIPTVKTQYYILKSQIPQLEQFGTTNLHTCLNILPPLDPLIIDRQMLLDIFGFHYRWEAYTPPSQRKYGYYNMPILYQGQFVGQVNLRKDLKGKLQIKNLYTQIPQTAEFKSALKTELQNLQQFISSISN